MLSLSILAAVVAYVLLASCTSVYMEDNGWRYPACFLGGMIFPVLAPLLLLRHLDPNRHQWPPIA